MVDEKKTKKKLLVYLIFFSVFIMLFLFFINTKEFRKKQFGINKKIDNCLYETDNITKEKEANTKTNIETNIEYDEKIDTKEVVGIQYKSNNWRIIISKINLDAPILEGTNKEILRRAVGHFENTSKWDGNVALAAHNRGYKYNYFEGLKRLELGDEIIYQTDKGTRKYEIVRKEKIKETDLLCLEDTEKNQLTLITCVENMPEYRLCIQAILKNIDINNKINI